MPLVVRRFISCQQKHNALVVTEPSFIGQGLPPPYKSSVDQNPDPQSDTNQRLEWKIADLEATMQKNSLDLHRMCNLVQILYIFFWICHFAT